MEGAELDLFDRGIRAATANGSGAVLDDALASLGWQDALVEDRVQAVTLLFESQGADNVTSSALDQVLAGALGVHTERTAVILPPLRTRDAPAKFDGDRCSVDGIALSSLERSETALVVAEAVGHSVALTLPTSTLSLRPVAGLDPALGLLHVGGDLSLDATDSRGPADWISAVLTGHLALGHELVGSTRAMLELARHYALERVQFGRPIASFQAIRHRLAESLVAVEAASALLAAAWDEPSPENAAIAKSSAGRGARIVARHCQQVLAGIGFTSEHPFHRYYRRSLVLDQLLGDEIALKTEFGTRALGTRTLPPVLPL
jgi:hypothetical protein